MNRNLEPKALKDSSPMNRISLYVLMILLAMTSVRAAAQNTGDAKSVFRKNCAICHGVDGRADTPLGKNTRAANLTSPAVQNLTDGQIRAIIANGSGSMPPFGPALGEAGLNGMVKYVRSLKSK